MLMLPNSNFVLGLTIKYHLSIIASHVTESKIRRFTAVKRQRGSAPKSPQSRQTLEPLVDVRFE